MASTARRIAVSTTLWNNTCSGPLGLGWFCMLWLLCFTCGAWREAWRLVVCEALALAARLAVAEFAQLAVARPFQVQDRSGDFLSEPFQGLALCRRLRGIALR
jgi:hypothetical protein